ncbi:Ribose operon repressor [Baekduia alba]|uniref:LacI family DNA-binding transcriptional regulator n=1 Tax=Baekduia alba TaxID=2997333 RepID=UPI00233FC9D1|nr:LacI family DNA-binding transcriptional regulator [Baekduia alba]WCB91732.1 Ribose operon repressor [Baekduia alba]
MSQRPVTLRDVAEAAGLHISTVSRVLSPETRGLVNEKTAQRIDAIIAELGYEPNRVARGLKTRRSMTVGVLINDLTNPVFPYVVRGIEDTLAKSGYTPLVANTDGDLDRQRRGFDALASRQVDGFILSTALREDPLVEEILDKGIPLALVVRNVDNHRAAAVTSDERLGTRLAVEHLVELGHGAIACVSGPEHISTGAARRAGFEEVMAARGLRVAEGLVRPTTGFTIKEGQRVMNELLDGGPPFTAVVAGNDMLAIGCIDALKARGLRCPEDVSIIGFNDMYMAGRLTPPLTTLHVPYYDLGAYAADLFLDQLAGRPPREITVVQSLIVRESTAPPPVRPAAKRPKRAG